MTEAGAWERQYGESDKAFRAFQLYRDLPPQERSVDRAWELYSGRTLEPGKRAPGTFQRWARTYFWKDRAAAWDDAKERELREAALEADRKAVREMRERHIKVALSFQRLGLEDLSRWTAIQADLAEKAKAKGKRPRPLFTPYQLMRLWSDATKLERVSRGEPDSIVETRDGDAPPAGGPLAGLDLSKLTHDELASLRALLQRAQPDTPDGT